MSGEALTMRSSRIPMADLLTLGKSRSLKLLEPLTGTGSQGWRYTKERNSLYHSDNILNPKNRSNPFPCEFYC